jgi:hypothetical protein
LNGLNHAERVEAMVAWFMENFEDPAEITPYESAEGGYLWIWGGPHDPAEELYDAFGDAASDADIEAAVAEVRSDGLFEWAPNQSRMFEEPDDDEPPPSLEDRLAALRGQLNELEQTFQGLRDSAPMMGHNQPPEDQRIGLDQRDLDEVQDSINAIRLELDKPGAIDNADPAPIIRAEGIFRRIVNKLRGWALAAAAAIPAGIGTGVGKTLWENRAEIIQTASAVADTLFAWAQHIQPWL